LESFPPARAAGKLLEKVTGPLPTVLRIAPPTKMDAYQLNEEGYYGTPLYPERGSPWLVIDKASLALRPLELVPHERITSNQAV